MAPITMHPFHPSAIVLLLLCLQAAPLAADEKEFDYGTLPSRRWVQLDEASREVPVGITAYSGMCFDPQGKQLLLFGGGHGDYFGNEVWSWHVPTRRWKRLTEPTPHDVIRRTKFDWDATPGMLPDLRLPVARHTYDSVEWIDHLGRMYAAGSSTWSSRDKAPLWDIYPRGATGPNKDKGWNPGDAWLFDPQKAAWSYRKAPVELVDGGTTCAYASRSKQLVRWDRRGTFLYDIERDQWTPVEGQPAPEAAIHCTMTYDGRRHCCYLVGSDHRGSDKLWRFDVERKAWSLLEPEGRAPTLRDGPGCAYDDSADVLVTYGKTGLWVYDLKTNVWLENPAKEGPSPPREGEYGSLVELYGRMKYDPLHKLVLAVVADYKHGVQVWGYRHAENVMPRR